jgi:hypothetical protein
MLRKLFGLQTDLTVDESKTPLDALAESYLATPCSVMSPYPGRLTLLDEMIEGFAVDLKMAGSHPTHVFTTPDHLNQKMTG